MSGKVFTVEGWFTAVDIDDAFAVLAAHFSELRDHGLDGSNDDGVTHMEVRPVTEST